MFQEADDPKVKEEMMAEYKKQKVRNGIERWRFSGPNLITIPSIQFMK